MLFVYNQIFSSKTKNTSITNFYSTLTKIESKMCKKLLFCDHKSWFKRAFLGFFKCRKTHFKTAEIAEIAQKLCRKFHFRIRKSNTFHIKVRKLHFKLRKALSNSKRALERYCKNKNVLKLDVEKYSVIIFLRFLF